jgi:hypothetical protein
MKAAANRAALLSEQPDEKKEHGAESKRNVQGHVPALMFSFRSRSHLGVLLVYLHSSTENH